MNPAPETLNEELRHELEEARTRFLEIIGDLRPALHRYCSRMLGSVLDGEDVVQDTLAMAYFRLSTLRDGDALRPWLFRVAHNRCIDVLRRRRHRELDLSEAPERGEIPEDPTVRKQGVAHALDRLVLRLPPKERASLLLKDVLGYSLAESAEIVGSTLGGVKAALKRARRKLAALEQNPPATRRDPAETDDRRRLLNTYVERFNAHDWDGVLALLRADARLEVVEIYEAGGRQAFTRRYFVNYPDLPFAWRMSVEKIDGDWNLLLHRREPDGWRPYRAVPVDIEDGAIRRVRDYLHCPDYLLDSVEIGASAIAL